MTGPVKKRLGALWSYSRHSLGFENSFRCSDVDTKMTTVTATGFCLSKTSVKVVGLVTW